MLRPAVDRLRRYVQVGVSGKGRQRLLVRVTTLTAVLLVVLGLVALVPLGWLVSLVLLETAVIVLAAGVFVLPPAKPKPVDDKRGAKRKRSLVPAPELVLRLTELPDTLARFRAVATASPLDHARLPLPLAPIDPEPLVTVIIPAFNEQQYLKVAITSVLTQTWRKLEVIVVDEGSSDTTPAIVARLAADDDRVRFVRHASPQGLSAARNAGLARTRGDLVIFLDGDDALHPTAIQQRVAALLGSDLRITAGSAGGAVRVRADWKADRLPPDRRSISLPTSLWTVGVRSPFGVHQVMLRRDVLDLSGAFDEELRHGAEDMDLWLRLLRRGYSIVDAPAVDSFYRQRPGSMIDGKRSHHLEASLRMLRADATRDDDPAFFDVDDATVGRVVAERVYGWCVLALVADQPEEALESLRMLSATELLALRSGVNLRAVTMDSLRRAELRLGGEGTEYLPTWRSAVQHIVDTVSDVAFGADQQRPRKRKVAS